MPWTEGQNADHRVQLARQASLCTPPAAATGKRQLLKESHAHCTSSDTYTAAKCAISQAVGGASVQCHSDCSHFCSSAAAHANRTLRSSMSNRCRLPSAQPTANSRGSVALCCMHVMMALKLCKHLQSEVLLFGQNATALPAAASSMFSSWVAQRRLLTMSGYGKWLL